MPCVRVLKERTRGITIAYIVISISLDRIGIRINTMLKEKLFLVLDFHTFNALSKAHSNKKEKYISC